MKVLYPNFEHGKEGIIGALEGDDADIFINLEDFSEGGNGGGGKSTKDDPDLSNPLLRVKIKEEFRANLEAKVAAGQIKATLYDQLFPPKATGSTPTAEGQGVIEPEGIDKAGEEGKQAADPKISTGETIIGADKSKAEPGPGASEEQKTPEKHTPISPKGSSSTERKKRRITK